MEIPSKQLAGPLQSSGRGSAKRDLAVVSMWMKRVGCRLTQERSEGAFLKKAYGGGGGWEEGHCVIQRFQDEEQQQRKLRGKSR